MQSLFEDVRFAVRMLGRQKMVTLVAAVTLALGIGMNAAIFSTVSGILWNSLPYPEPERLVAIWGTNPKMGFGRAYVAYREVDDFRKAQGLEKVSAHRFSQVSLTGTGEPGSVEAVESDVELFDVIGEKAALGRTYADSERAPGEHRVAVITEGLWRREFGGNPSAVGREIRLDGANYTVIGVMPPEFSYMYSKAEVFIPLRLKPDQKTQYGTNMKGLRAIGRLAAGRTAESAEAEVQRIAKAAEESEPDINRGWSAVVRPLELEVIDRGARTSIQTMFWTVFGVLLIACTNIAGLLMARGTLRQRELAIRASLGAGKARIARLLVTESVVLSLFGGVLGVAFAAWAIPVLRSLAPPGFPRLEQVTLNPMVVLYTFLLCLVTGVLAGVAPAWMMTRGELARSLHEGGRGGTFSRQRSLQGLVAAEVALAMVLLTVTGLLVRSLVGQLYGNPGFDKTHLMTAVVNLPEGLYPEDKQLSDFHTAALQALRRDGRIESAGAAQTIPLGGTNSWAPVLVEGREKKPDERNLVGYMVVSPGYFTTLRVPLLGGRDLAETDGWDAVKVAVINETMARRYWPGEAQPIGRRFRIAGTKTDKEEWITVVGISRDVRHSASTLPPRPEMHLAMTQTGGRRLIYMARTKGDPAQAAAALREAVRTVDRNQPLTSVESMEDLIGRRSAGPRVTAQILGFLAGLALLLAGVGIYGVLSYLTSQRAREFGIRVAMGAVRRDIVGLVVRRGVVLAGGGLLVGCGVAFAVTPLVRSLLSGVEPHDGVTFAGSAGALLGVGVLACVVPVLRALRTDPVKVLREE